MSKETIHLSSLRLPLFLTRVFIAYFMAMWAFDRFHAPEHAQKVADKFYALGPLKLSALPQPLIGGFLILLIAAFLIGFQKRITYGLVLLLHAIGSLMILPNLWALSDSFTLIFTASLPTLGAMILLYCLRNEDNLLSIDR